MTMLLLGASAVAKENVLRILPICEQLGEQEAELLVLFHKTIRIYSINGTRLVIELNVSDIVNDGLPRLLGGGQLPRDLKYHLLDAIVYKQGILVIIAVNRPPSETLDFYVAYVSEQAIKSRRRSEFMFKIEVPDELAIRSPFHENSLPRVTLHLPNLDECAVVFPKFVLLISKIAEPVRHIIREEFDDHLLGVATRNGFCHLILKDTGICALRRLPKLFDLSFWKKYRSHLQKPTGEFLGRDFDQLKQAFFTFCSKDMDKAAEQSQKFTTYNEVNFSNVVVLFLKRLLNGAPLGDPRWSSGGGADDSSYGQADKKVVIMSQLREKLSLYRMFFLYLCTFKLLNKLDIALPDQGEKIARTLLLEFGEKLLAMLDCFEWMTMEECSVVEHSIEQLSRRFASQFDHPTNHTLTPFDHFFKEVSAFEEFVPELVKCENHELDKCVQDYTAKVKVVLEVGSALQRIANAASRARRAEWSATPASGTLTWINQPRSMKYFIQHLNMAFALLAQKPIVEVAEQLERILESTECVARLVLSEQDQCQRNNSQIIAKFYEINRTELALKLAEDFKDFTMLIRHSHIAFNDEDRPKYLQELKERFKEQNFDMCLYEYYRKNGMFEYLLEEQGERVENFLSHHENIGWIRNIESSQYKKARTTLKNMTFEANNAEKKATVVALGKLCALCEEKVDPMEVAYFIDALTLLNHQDAIDKNIAKRINPANRPLKPTEIIDAYLEERTAVGYVKALLLVSHMFSSLSEQITKSEARKLVRRIYSTIFTADELWKNFDLTDVERLKIKASRTALSSVLYKLSEMELTQDLKNVLLPAVEDLPKMISVDERRMKIIKDYLFAELLSFKFYADDQQERMET